MKRILDEDKTVFCAEHLHEGALREFVRALARLNLKASRPETNLREFIDGWVATAEVDATPGLREKLLTAQDKFPATKYPRISLAEARQIALGAPLKTEQLYEEAAEHDPYAHDMISAAEVDGFRNKKTTP